MAQKSKYADLQLRVDKVREAKGLPPKKITKNNANEAARYLAANDILYYFEDTIFGYDVMLELLKDYKRTDGLYEYNISNVVEEKFEFWKDYSAFKDEAHIKSELKRRLDTSIFLEKVSDNVYRNKIEDSDWAKIYFLLAAYVNRQSIMELDDKMIGEKFELEPDMVAITKIMIKDFLARQSDIFLKHNKFSK